MFVVISDTHFGDEDCGLVVENKKTNEYELGELYHKFKETIGNNHEYMILLGDVFDFAVKSYSKAYEIGKIFLNQVVKDKIVTKGFIYLPGNHDFDLWNLIEYEVNIINRLKNNKSIRDFRHTVPGIIDARDENAEFYLYGVAPNEEENSEYRYGGLYLDNLIDKENRYTKDNKKITFNIAYPNLYLFTKEETILFNHGHYLGAFWALFSEYGHYITEENPKSSKSTYFDVKNMKDMVSINFPLNQFTSSGVGQSGKFREVVAQVEHKLKENKVGKVKLYLNNFFRIFKLKTKKNFLYFFKKGFINLIRNTVRKHIVNMIESYTNPRNNKDFLAENIERLKEFYNVSVKELEDMKHLKDDKAGKFLKSNLEKHLQKPTKIVYGHTHVPSPLNGEPEKVVVDNIEILTYNTGGYLSKSLDKDGNNIWRGAKIFFINKKGEMTSKAITNQDLDS